jgi:hypothetical protein
MQIPNAETIEGAVDSVLRLDARQREEQLSELREAIGAHAAGILGVPFPLSTDFQQGYVLALQVARTVVAGSAEVLMHGAEPKKIL